MNRADVDFALAKMDSVFREVAPDIQAVGEDFVAYTVFKQGVEFWGSLGAFAVMAACAVVFRAIWAKNRGEGVGAAAIIIGSLSAIPLTFAVIEGCEYLIAKAHPVMFTLDRFL